MLSVLKKFSRLHNRWLSGCQFKWVQKDPRGSAFSPYLTVDLGLWVRAEIGIRSILQSSEGKLVEADAAVAAA